MNRELKRELLGALVWAGIMLALTLGATVAQKSGYIGRDTVIRVLTCPIGLWMAWYGNWIPKSFVRSAQGRQAQRVAAWSLVLSGLVYAGLWAFAPIPLAVKAGSGAIVAGIAVTFGYCLSLRRAAITV